MIDGEAFENSSQGMAEAWRQVVRHCSPPGTPVLDACGGPATLTQAAWEEGRDSLYVDHNPNMLTLAKARLMSFTQGMAQLKDDDEAVADRLASTSQEEKAALIAERAALPPWDREVSRALKKLNAKKKKLLEDMEWKWEDQLAKRFP